MREYSNLGPPTGQRLGRLRGYLATELRGRGRRASLLADGEDRSRSGRTAVANQGCQRAGPGRLRGFGRRGGVDDVRQYRADAARRGGVDSNRDDAAGRSRAGGGRNPWPARYDGGATTVDRNPGVSRAVRWLHTHHSKGTMVKSLITATVFALGAGPVAAQEAMFVLRAGKDTISLERFTVTATRIESEILIKPNAVRLRFSGAIGADGLIGSLENNFWMATDSATAPARQNAVITMAGDSALRTSAGAGRPEPSASAPRPAPCRTSIHRLRSSKSSCAEPRG